MNKRTALIRSLIIISILLLGSVILVGLAIGFTPQKNQPAPVPMAMLPNTDELWRLSNQERAKAGLPDLSRMPDLDRAAEARCADMQAKGYWAHVAPDGTKYSEIIRKFGSFNDYYVGENLSKDGYTAGQVTQSWMNSPEHRENILKSRYQLVGYAVCDGSQGVLAVQDFAGR